jgi:5-formyltetrahydrofolate cyclo-ligase
MINRQRLRAMFRAKRRSLNVNARNLAANQLVRQIERLPVFLTSQYLAAYVAHEGEIDPAPLLQLAWRLNKRCYLPALMPENKLAFTAYSANDPLIHNQYHIPEPVLKPDKLITPAEIDILLLPLVAFDSQGNRLGRGAGYYDRALAFLQRAPRPAKPYLLGLAYEWQRVDALPAANWDVRLNAIATEKNIYEALL